MSHMGGIGGAVSAVTSQAFQARLQRDSATQISLQRYAGNVCVVNGENIDPGSGGLSLLTTTNLLSATGADSGAAMAASTLYYVYISNTSATFRSSSLGASATASTLVNGVKYLAATGNGANWRFCGYVRTDASTQFVDTTTDRLVVNYYNRRWKRLFANPAYSDGNTADSYTFTSTTWAALNGGTGSRCTYIANGEDDIMCETCSVYSMSTTTNSFSVGMGLDSTASALNDVYNIIGVAGNVRPLSMALPVSAAEGYHTLDVLGLVDGGTATVYADAARNGSSADPRRTGIYTMVPV